MASTIPEQESATPSSVARVRGPATPPPKSPAWFWRVFIALVVVTGVTFALYAARREFMAGPTESSNALVHQVKKDDLLVTVTEDGNVESVSNLDIKCQVAGGSSILWIIDDGETVAQGDKLVELDSSSLEESINQQQIAFEKARSAQIQAEKNFAVAKLAVQEFLEGTYKQQLQDAEATITIALENLRSAENTVEHAERMFRKGYVSSLELEGQRFAVQRAQLELDSARTAKDVLVNFTKVKTLQDLESQRDTAEAQMQSEKAAFELEEIRLKRLKDQLANCVIYAPQAGMVVYANDRGGRFGQSEASIEEGAQVRERQTILRLPDLDEMQVNVKVHESKVDQLRPGMPARVRILERELPGEVTSIANQPEPTSFFSANVKEYSTIVKITGQPEGLRPGMTAEVEILVANLKDILTVPVAAVLEQSGKFYAWVQDNGFQRRSLVVGMTDDQFMEVQDGLAEAEMVVLNPRAAVPEAKELISAEIAASEDGRFGDATVPPVEAESPAGRRSDGPGLPGGGFDTSDAGPGERPERGNAGPSRPRGEGRGPRAGGGGRSGGGSRDLMQFDQDGDQRVSKEEAPDRMQSFFDRLDGDGDGYIDQAEIDSLRQRFGGGQGGEPSGGEPSGGEPSGGGPSGSPGQPGP